MWRFMRNWKRAAGIAVLLPVMAACVAACSSDAGTINVVPKASDLLRPDWTSFSGHKEEFSLRPPGPQDLVNTAGYCQGSVAQSNTGQAAPEQATVQGGIALQMTECDVVRRAGTPERTEIGADNGGERSVVMTFVRSPRPGIYRFTGGRLQSVERGAQPETSERPKAASSKKRT